MGYDLEVRDLLTDLKAENERLRGHIKDIAEHATPFGDIPGEPGWVGRYLLTAGALHRAIGAVKEAHSPRYSCAAEAKLAKIRDLDIPLRDVLRILDEDDPS